MSGQEEALDLPKTMWSQEEFVALDSAEESAIRYAVGLAPSVSHSAVTFLLAHAEPAGTKPPWFEFRKPASGSLDPQEIFWRMRRRKDRGAEVREKYIIISAGRD